MVSILIGSVAMVLIVFMLDFFFARCYSVCVALIGIRCRKGVTMAKRDDNRYSRIWLTYPVDMRDRLYRIASDIDSRINPVMVLALRIGLRELELRLYGFSPDQSLDSELPSSMEAS